MAQSPIRLRAWGPVMVGLVIGAVIAGVIAWQLNLRSLEEQIRAKRATLKKLALSRRIPPNQSVMDYLSSRQASLEARYQHWVDAATAAPALTDAAKADPQLYFQERFHEVQRTVERLAAARGIEVPEQLGFPKELPPSDTVPRLLIQLALIQEATELIVKQEVSNLSSLKVEDPEPVSGEDDERTFLLQLPVRVRLSATLPRVLNVLAAIHQARPLIDVRALRVVPLTEPGHAGGPQSDVLDVELVLSRHLLLAAASEGSAEMSPAERP